MTAVPAAGSDAAAVASAKTPEQIADQCRVVAHLARQIASVHEQMEPYYAAGPMSPFLLDLVGNRTARLMETLGDVLNGMDAVDESDAWTASVFRIAQATWPQPAESVDRAMPEGIAP